MIFLIAAAVLWLGIGYLSSAFYFASLQRTFPTVAEESRGFDKCVATILVFVGPLGVGGSFGSSALWGMVHNQKTYHNFDFSWPIR